MSAEARMSLAPERDVNFPQPMPDSAGIPEAVADQMLIAPFNDLVIAGPLLRVIPPVPGFLEAGRGLSAPKRCAPDLRRNRHRVSPRLRGAQERYGVVPDICPQGKIIGGGLPLAALGASAEIMAHFDKTLAGSDNWLMRLGTLWGNPVTALCSSEAGQFLPLCGIIHR